MFFPTVSVQIVFWGDHFNPQTSKTTCGNSVKVAQFCSKTTDLATLVINIIYSQLGNHAHVLSLNYGKGSNGLTAHKLEFSDLYLDILLK